MRRNLWTVLTVFVLMFALAWILNQMKAGALEKESGGGRSGSAEGDGRLAGSARGAEGAGEPEPAAGANTGDIEQEMAPPPATNVAPAARSGLAGGGSGRYQLYRQGDVTLRLDTETGKACVLLATEALWRNARVFDDACRLD